MDDLISRSALLAEYDRVHVGPPGGARKLMEDAPAVDAVEVIRCKDCEQLIYLDDRPAPDYPFCEWWQHEVDPEFDYCSKAERKKNV